MPIPRVGGIVPLLALLVGCGSSSSPSSSAPPTGTSPSTGSCGAGTPVAGTPRLTSIRIAAGLANPTDLQTPPGDHARLFVVEQIGRIRIVRAGALGATPFLDIVSRVGAGGERGLLGLAFHPRYAQNGRFFVNYTDKAGDTHIVEFRGSSNPDLADPNTERELLFVKQPFANHNGGGLAFGPDGMLYIALGDGGSAGDPQRNAQNLATPLGKLLRIDVDGTSPYRVPPDNPFASTSGAFPAIWAYGLRNPWRFTFDGATGDLLIADVGQGAVEEVDLGSRGGGDNFGWNVMEGSRCFQPPNGCNGAGLKLPILEYSHADGCSISGGVVYRGCRMPGYQGTYFYGDYCTGFVRSFRLQNGVAVDRADWTSSMPGINQVVAFGADADGEVYVVDYDGEIYEIVPIS